MNQYKKKIWIAAFSHLNRDPRVYRQIQWLSDRYELTTFGFSSSGIEGVKHIDILPPSPPLSWIHPLKWLRKARSAYLQLSHAFEKFYWTDPLAQNALKAFESMIELPDLLLVNDVDILPAAVKGSKGTKFIVDLHEYAPREWEDIWKWRTLVQPRIEYVCRTYLPAAVNWITVCPGIALEYQRHFDIYPKVMTNSPPYYNLKPHKTGVDRIRMIHHGVAAASRKIEQMIVLMDHLDERFELDLILVPGDQTYIKRMQQLGQKNPNIRFLPSLPMQEIVPFTNHYDIGLFLLPPTNFNYLHALPNKFFEFVQARLAVAIGPSPEMQYYTENYQLGVVSETFEPKQLAKKLNSLTTDQIDQFKQNAHQAAEHLHAGKNQQILLEIVQQALRG